VDRIGHGRRTELTSAFVPSRHYVPELEYDSDVNSNQMLRARKQERCRGMAQKRWLPNVPYAGAQGSTAVKHKDRPKAVSMLSK
jgi:hypothetical protein